jgi:hypothetical protein
MREVNWRKALNVGGVGICMLGAFIAIRFPRRQWITQHVRNEALQTLSRAPQVYPVETCKPSWRVDAVRRKVR